MTSTEIFERHEAAKRTLDDEGFRLAMAELKKEQVEAFFATRPDEIAAREESHRMALAIDRIEQRLRGMVADWQSHQKQDRHRGND